jgi:hypothetical protein
MGGKNWELRIPTRMDFPPGARSRVRPYAAGMERTRLTAVTMEETRRLFHRQVRNFGSLQDPRVLRESPVLAKPLEGR